MHGKGNITIQQKRETITSKTIIMAANCLEY